MKIALVSNFHLCNPFFFLLLLVCLLYALQNSTGLSGTSRPAFCLASSRLHLAGLGASCGKAGEADGAGDGELFGPRDIYKSGAGVFMD